MMKIDSKLALLLLQVPVVLAILAWVPGNLAKLLALLVLWALTFPRPSKQELVFFFGVNLFFTLMNAAALKQGIFTFSSPDVLGMPVYELFMWGFYLLHLKHVLNGPAPEGNRKLIWALAIAYAITFSSIPDARILLIVSSILLITCLALFHEPLDIAYTVYLVALGAAIEYTGVFSGEWSYPNSPWGGVPLWFITMWGGVGFFMRRLILPMLKPSKN